MLDYVMSRFLLSLYYEIAFHNIFVPWKNYNEYILYTSKGQIASNSKDSCNSCASNLEDF